MNGRTSPLRNWTLGAATAACASLACVAGCETSAQTGGLAGAGIGALAGQLIGRSTGATLIGTAVGGGIGYVVGNEKDKKHALEMNRDTRVHNYTHTEVGPLGGTRWQLISVNPKSETRLYASKIVEFRPYGRVITTTTNLDGTVDVTDEHYRVVDKTLIVNRPELLINARYDIQGDQLVLSAADFSAVLTRIR